MKNLEKVTLELNIYNACRTNTGIAYSNDSMHYNFPFLAKISGARFENTLSDLEWCAENKEDEMAIKQFNISPKLYCQPTKSKEKLTDTFN